MRNLELHAGTLIKLSIQIRHKHAYVSIGRKNFRRQLRRGSMPLRTSIKLGSISDAAELKIATKEYILHGLVILTAIIVGLKSLYEIFFPKDGFSSPFGRPCWTNWDLDVNVKH